MRCSARLLLAALVALGAQLPAPAAGQRMGQPPSFPSFVDPLPDLGESHRRETPKHREPTTSDDYLHFYRLKIFREYELNATNWNEIWVDFDEHPVSQQRRLIGELRSKQKTIEMMLIHLCENPCIREACGVSLDRNLEILPKNPERWARYDGLDWLDIPQKVKRLVVMQLRVDRFRIASALQMMNLEICQQPAGDRNGSALAGGENGTVKDENDSGNN